MTPAWEVFADVLLHREAALCRIVSGVPPRDFAGLYVANEDLDGLLRSLPGLDGPLPETAAPVRDAFADALSVARQQLYRWLDESDEPLARAARKADLNQRDLEVLALVAAVELNPQRQRVVAYIQDSVNLPRLTLATLRRIFGPADGDCAMAETAPLRRAALIALDETGPWAIRMSGLPPRVAWAIRGDRSPDPGLPTDARLLEPAEPGYRRDPEQPPVPLLLVHGADRESRRQLVRARYPWLPLLATAPPANDAAWAALLREACLTGAAVVLEPDAALDAVARRTLERATHLTWVVSSPRELPLECLPDRRFVRATGGGRHGGRRRLDGPARRRRHRATDDPGSAPPGRGRLGRRRHAAGRRGAQAGRRASGRAGRPGPAPPVLVRPGTSGRPAPAAAGALCPAPVAADRLRRLGVHAGAVQRRGRAVRRRRPAPARPWPPRWSPASSASTCTRSTCPRW